MGIASRNERTYRITFAGGRVLAMAARRTDVQRALKAGREQFGEGYLYFEGDQGVALVNLANVESIERTRGD